MKKIIVLLLFIFMVLSLTSCGLTGSQTLSIAEIKTEQLEDKNIKVTISYVDDVEEPVSFVIPRGNDGLGIKDVQYEYNKDDDTTDVTFFFDNDTIDPYTIQIKNGISIKECTSVIDDTTGDTLITIVYSDDSKETKPIRVQKGEPGLSVVNIETIENHEVDPWQVSFVFTLSNEEQITVGPVELKSGLDGQDGRGILNMTGKNEDGQYILDIEYTNGDTLELYLERSNTIFTLVAKPDSDYGINGDYAYVTSEKVMYRKTNNNWVSVFSLNEASYEVELDLNDEGDASLGEHDNKYTIIKGHYFESDGYELPIPTRPGYTFGGWFLAKNPKINNGQFTDTTAVYKDMTLYAKWVLND